MMAAKCRRVKLPGFGRMPWLAEWPALVLAASLDSFGWTSLYFAEKFAVW